MIKVYPKEKDIMHILYEYVYQLVAGNEGRT